MRTVDDVITWLARFPNDAKVIISGGCGRDRQLLIIDAHTGRIVRPGLQLPQNADDGSGHPPAPSTVPPEDHE